MVLHRKRGRAARVVGIAAVIWSAAVLTGFLIGQFLSVLGYEWVHWE